MARHRVTLAHDSGYLFQEKFRPLPSWQKCFFLPQPYEKFFLSVSFVIKFPCGSIGAYYSFGKSKFYMLD